MAISGKSAPSIMDLDELRSEVEELEEAVLQRCFVNKVFFFIKKRLWHRCFPVNFVKFLETPFFTEHLLRLLLNLKGLFWKKSIWRWPVSYHVSTYMIHLTEVIWIWQFLLPGKCLYSDFFWSVFRPNVGEYGPENGQCLL